MKRPLPPERLAVSPGDLVRESVAGFLARLESEVDAGLCGLLLREPAWEHGPYLRLAQKVLEVLDGGMLLLHDTPHLVQAAGAQGVHLGYRSLPPLLARASLNDEHLVGLSTHVGDDLDPPGVDYVFYSPVFETPSKQGLLEPVGLQGLRQRVQASTLPVWGLGGIDRENLQSVLDQGAAGVAMRSAYWS